MHLCTEGRLTQDASESSVVWSTKTTIQLFSTLECNILKVTETISEGIREGGCTGKERGCFCAGTYAYAEKNKCSDETV